MATSEVESLWPSPPGATLTDRELAAIYAYPPDQTHPWVRANFVTSLDGAASVNGRSAPLSGPTDQRLFRLLRALSDVILVGAGTVRAEGYGHTHHDVSDHAALRAEQRLSPVPRLAVVTRSADLDPASPLFAENVVAPIVLTCRAASVARRAVLADAGADVVLAGEQDVSLTCAVGALARRGFRRVLCEGGPQLLAGMLAADVVDELCLTLAPILVGGNAPRIAHGGAVQPPMTMSLASIARGDDLLLRYRRDPA